MMETPEGISLYKKILAASEQIKSLSKDGTEDQHKYEYLSAEKIVTEAKRALHDNGLIAYGSVTKVEELPPAQRAFRQRTYMDGFIVDVDTGESLVVKVTAMGVDQWDKADGKANTYAFKYFLKRVLMIESGEDESDEKNQDGGGPKEDGDEKEARERQRTYDKLAVLVKALDYNAAKKLEVLNKFGGNVKHMSIRTLNEVREEFEKRLRELGKELPSYAD